jgi:uncharacterized protein (DUF427 family)
MKAIWNGQVIAESDNTLVVESNHYFPPASVNKAFLTPSETKTTCAWKGEASYYHITVDGEKNRDAAWYYPNPKPKAEHIKDHIAFWKGVEITE